MQHFFTAWENIGGRIREARRILIVFDFDGTLTPIMDTPEIVELSEDMRELLRNLSKHRAYTVAIVSGRALNDIQNKVGIPGIIYAGNHGLEIAGPNMSFVHPIAEEIRPVLRIMGLILKKTLGKIKGAAVEDKGITLTIHYRLAGENELERIRNAVTNTVGLAEELGKVKTTNGKKVLEVKPDVPWDKGKAVQYIMKRQARGGRESGVLPIYMGDDLTDEDAFKFVENYGGITVYVGEENNRSIASYYLRSTKEVEDSIRRLLSLN